MSNTIGEAQYQSSWRFKVGLALFVLGWLCPLFIPLVTMSALSAEAKTLLSGALLFGVPEVFSLLSIALLGRDGFNLIKSQAFALIKRAAPSSPVSRLRYRVGLFLLLPHVLYANMIFYAPGLIPLYKENSLQMNLIADALFIATLFVLGGDFWEKIRALFYYEARATFPDNG
jgi:hypothetical protein